MTKRVKCQLACERRVGETEASGASNKEYSIATTTKNAVSNGPLSFERTTFAFATGGRRTADASETTAFAAMSQKRSIN